MSVWLYWLGVKTYEMAVRIAALWNKKAAAAVQGRHGLLRKVEAAMNGEDRPRIWMHCASLGEFEQGRPVLEALREAHPGHAIVLTFFSPSGYNVQKNWPGADHVFYLPFDGSFRARRFIAALRPSLTIWVKYEFWYFILRSLNRANIPTILIAALFSPSSVPCRWWGGIYRRMLRGFSYIFVQDEASRQTLQGAGIFATAAGDPRYDRVLQAAEASEKISKAEKFAAGGFTLVAGSTWPADEAMLAEAFNQLPREVNLLLVPHEVEEAHLQSIEAKFGGDSIRWSGWGDRPAPRVLLVDSVGLLMNLYRYAHIAYVGGGFGRAGVHNVLEPAAYGVPVLMGPMHEEFVEAGALVRNGGAAVVRDAADFVTMVSWLVGDEDARQAMGKAAMEAVQQGAGATERIVGRIEEAGWLSGADNTNR